MKNNAKIKRSRKSKNHAKPKAHSKKLNDKKAQEINSREENENKEKIETIIKTAKAINSTKVDKSIIILILAALCPLFKVFLNEKFYRIFYGSISLFTKLTINDVCHCSGLSQRTISKARKEISKKSYLITDRQRKKGAGRKSIAKTKPHILLAILNYVNLRAYGPCTKDTTDYTAATLSGIQKFLKQKYNFVIGRTTLFYILATENIKLRTNKKLLYGNQKSETESQRVIRHLQFDLIYATLDLLENEEYIILSIDTKKKENLGNFKPSGKQYTFSYRDAKSNSYDFFKKLDTSTLKDVDDLLDREEGKAIPYGIYDVKLNKCYFNVGISHDTPQFVAASIKRFLPEIMKDHKNAKTLVLLCDGGGSNSANSNLFKYYMAQISKISGLKVMVVHYPPYRSKFNKIERKVFAYVSKQFERTQLCSLRKVITLINNTTTEKGLVNIAKLDAGIYELKQKVDAEQMEAFDITYFGPTKDAKKHLSYIIDGSKLTDSDITIDDRKDVFELKGESADCMEKDEP